MKEVKCSRCGKKVLVSDTWKYRRCSTCHEKDLLYDARRKEIRKLDRDNSLSQSLRAKYPQSKTFKDFTIWFKSIWHRDPSFDEFLRFKEEIRAKESREKAKVESLNTRRQLNLEKLINEPKFPFLSEDCLEYRSARLKDKRDFDESASMTHTYKCKVCTAWLDWLKFEAEEKELREGDLSPFDKPLNLGANFWKGEPETESPFRSKPLDRDLERTEFNDDNSDFRKVKRKNGD